MSNVSFMDKLLEGVEVEWKALGDTVSFQRGKRLIKSQLEESGKYAVYQNSMKPLGYYHESNVEAESTFIICAGAAGEIGYSKGEIWAADDVYFATTPKIVNSRYLYHYLLTQKGKIAGQVRRASIPRLSKPAIEKLIFPIPCPENPKKSLQIQSAIVRILDKFTELTAELTAELTDRKKQYSYYRDQLLTFEEGEVEWKTLGEVALDFGRGKSKHRPRNDERLYGGEIPFIQTGDIRKASHTIAQYRQTYSEFGLKQSKLWPEGTLCITIAANIAETSILGFDACFPDSVIGFVADPTKTSAGYVEYLLQSTKNKLEEKGREKSSAQSNINLATFEQLKLPFPSLAEQTRIAAILDKFEALIHSIIEGLPREIELRQKQYEYYRDLLLSFPKDPLPTSPLPGGGV
ncbi:Type I restriction enzyme specificity protein [Piscirickettsia salmonis]|uniref:restriction endonuclease subunit S n=1 Tax=Piscirickettsia salmonis TaxID=1238 RepID=UPI0012BAC693|nr:restriction endonuclease subunit S [Piscirickettsia salmonis]QGP56617.1 Type I restriction enzyme specificity protein [Piscirickettsia salmonis]QGP61423.1 Type I restriction enzyme specificity protein [Piscirickettsia salmonis]QGP66189.1 Type I restriction enzyme specificity protein [Piscirickettsia salmonis]